MPIVSEGSYTPPTTRADYNGGSVSIANNAAASLTWDFLGVGTELFNRTDPALPVVLAPGIYAVTVTAAPVAAMTVGGLYVLGLEMDVSGDDVLAAAHSPGVITADRTPQTAVSLDYFLPSGATIKATVTNFDGVSTRTFHLTGGLVQRIT